MNIEIPNVLARLEVGEPTSVHGFALVPLDGEDFGGDADLLEDALSTGASKVTEVSANGSVGSVLVTHTGVRPLLLLDGEEILGAKQNRMVNASFLIPPGCSVEIPVSCVERRRWHYARPDFAAAGRTVTTSIRARKLARVVTSTSMRMERRYDTGQSAVWEDVEGYIERTAIRSVTSSFADAYRARAGDVERTLADLRVGPRQIGVAAVRDGAVVSLDVFGCASLFARASRKILRGILADAQDNGPATSAAAPADALVRALAAIGQASLVRTPAPGCGETLHGVAGELAVGALVHEGRLYHLVSAAAR